MTSAFDEYSSRLVALAESDERVQGVVLLGSGADTGRIDEWSDHDLALVVDVDAADEFRADAAWLPDATQLAAVGREWHDGFKGVFDDGRVIEYAVTDLDALRTFPLTSANVLFDRGGVREAVDQAAHGSSTRVVSTAEGLAAAFLVQVLVGVGRVRRGERLSGGHIVRGEAALTLLDLRLTVSLPGVQHPDAFDGWRRIESIDAPFAARVDALLAQDPESAAHGLLLLAEEAFAGSWAAWPSRGARAVRRRLGWSE